MRLTELSIRNFRSIKKFESFRVNNFQAILGENNCGKSNILAAIDAFLGAGSGGLKRSDFNDCDDAIVIKAKFKVNSPQLRSAWKPYLIGDELILQKHFRLEIDPRSFKESVKAEFHGYKSNPKEWFLSIEKIIAAKGDRPKWKEIVEVNGMPDYFLDEKGNCTKTLFEKGLSKYIQENDIEFDEPDLSETQALGLSSVAVSNLPRFYLLKAITDYSDEVDKRTTNTTFRRLMADLSDRIIKKDPQYIEIQTSLDRISTLLNKVKIEGEEGESRLQTIGIIESRIQSLLVKLMPSVEGVKLKVETEDIKSIFSKGVELLVNDGVETDVLAKGHGLQRCIVFSLLQSLILNERNELVDGDEEKKMYPIILAIEEPELYIHPQLGKLFYDVLEQFANSDQVIYTTHSPRFIDVSEYENIALASKTKENGTIIKNCKVEAFDGIDNKKIYKGISQLNSDVNELFFARRVLLVEGSQDKVGVIETLKKLGLIHVRPEELDFSIIVTDGKGSIPFFARVLNAFEIKYVILHDGDIKEMMTPDEVDFENKRNGEIHTLCSGNVVIFPCKMEKTLGLDKHFKDQYEAYSYFSKHENINEDYENIIKQVRTKLIVKKKEETATATLV